jgi:hypothetical protein
MYSDYRWDGKELLEIEEPVIVAANTPVTAPEPDHPEEPPILRMGRMIADGVDKLNNLNTRIANVGLFVAIVLVCILIELWHRL